LPSNLQHSRYVIYAIVKDNNGNDIRIAPAELLLDINVMHIHIPIGNEGINEHFKSLDQLEDDWYEALEASFLALIMSNQSP